MKDIDENHPEFEQLTTKKKECILEYEDANYLEKLYKMYFTFLWCVGNALEMLTKMLSSKGNMDVNEAIKCIRMLKRYGVEGVDIALNKMLLLIF